MDEIKFELIGQYKDAGLPLPVRKTVGSAGYDFVCAEDTVVPSLSIMTKQVKDNLAINIEDDQYIDLSTMAELTKQGHFRPTLIPTGVKCKMPKDYYLQLSVRSSAPLKHWLILANGVAVIDSDYYKPAPTDEGEGHIQFQLINLSPFNIIIKKGEAVGQGVFLKYATTTDDCASGERNGLGFGSTDR